MSKLEFEFPVVGATPPLDSWQERYAKALREHRIFGATLASLKDAPECHDQNEIAAFVVGLMFVIRENPVKSDAVYSYVRRAASEKEFLTELASRIIVMYNAELRKRDNDQEVNEVREAISRVQL